MDNKNNIIQGNLQTFKNASNSFSEINKDYLELALSKHNFDIADYIIKSDKFKMPYLNYYKELALNAVKKDNDVVKFLLKYIRGTHRKILIKSAKCNNIEILKFIETLHKIYYQPLVINSLYYGNTEYARYCIDKGRSELSFKRIIDLCVNKNNFDIALYCLENYYNDFNFTVNSHGIIKVAGIAAYNGNIEKLKYILEKYFNNVDLSNDKIEYILNEAIKGDKLDTIIYIINLSKNKENAIRTVLYDSAYYNSINAFKYAIKIANDYFISIVIYKACKGDSLNIIIELKHSNLNEILESAIFCNSINILRYLIENRGVKYNYETLINAAKSNSIDAFKYMVTKFNKVDIDKIAEICVNYKSNKILEYLLSKYKICNKNVLSYVDKDKFYKCDDEILED